MRILFTGGGGVATKEWISLFSPEPYHWYQRRHWAYFADANPDAITPQFGGAGWFQVPMASDERAFVLDMRTICAEHHIDLLVPGVDEELGPLAAARESFPCAILLPSLGFIQTHLHKHDSMWALEMAGIPVPRTTSLMEATFPAIIKPKVGRGSRHVRLVRSPLELDAHVVLSGLSREQFIAQEPLQGQEYTVTVVADQMTRLRAIIPIRVDLKRGITVKGTVVEDAAVTALCRQIHRAFPVSGIYNVQCVKGEDGIARPFEINPRISTTTVWAARAARHHRIDLLSLALEGELVPFQAGQTRMRMYAEVA